MLHPPGIYDSGSVPHISLNIHDLCFSNYKTESASYQHGSAFYGVNLFSKSI